VKPEVLYVDLHTCDVGQPARVQIRRHWKLMWPFNSPVWISTTKVVTILRTTPDGPVFETANSTYKPYPVDMPPFDKGLKLDIKPEKASC
jgi:hypothetical protein